MAAKEEKIKSDISKALAKFDSSKKNPEISKNALQTINSLRNILQKGGNESDLEAKKLINTLKKDKTFTKLPEEFRYHFVLYEEQVADSKEPGKDGKGGGGGSSPAPSSPKQQCKENQAVNIGSAPGPTQSSKSPSLSKKGNAGPAMIQKDVPVQGKKSPSPASAETIDTEKLNKEKILLEKELNAERKKCEEQSKISEKRANEIQELQNENKENEEKIKRLGEEHEYLSKRIQEENVKRGKAEKEIKGYLEQISMFEKQVNDSFEKCHLYERNIKELEAACKKLEKEKSKIEHISNQNIEHLQNVLKEEKRKSDDAYKKLLEERDDLRDRFSKLAGKKLQEQNADIADLSDPNRAMKLSERFGQLYDDEWTNAFEYLTDKKGGLQLKDAINLLLRLLQECWIFCNNLLEMQMESLNNVFLHPDQNPDKYVHQGKKGVTDRPRVTSKDAQALKDVRRRIGMSPSVIDEVKQALLTASKSWEKEKKGFDKKHIDACAPYLQKCTEICWLMALHDPALFMKMDVQQGEKLDPNIYSVYSVSGTSIDFLVWPPLYNGKEGGLLSKGVAEPQRIVGKKK